MVSACSAVLAKQSSRHVVVVTRAKLENTKLCVGNEEFTVKTHEKSLIVRYTHLKEKGVVIRTNKEKKK